MGNDIKSETDVQEFSISIFESLQIDLGPTLQKKKRKIDDYDYNDDFIEPFEGELDAVELECKLQNFFVYKGEMESDPKRIAKKYNNRSKKTKLVDALLNDNQKIQASTSFPILFEFQHMLSNAYNQNSKYKKETKFENVLMCYILLNSPSNEFDYYSRSKVLALFDNEKYKSESILTENNNSDRFLEAETVMKNKIEETFTSFLKIANDKSNYSNDRKTFKLFQDEIYVRSLIDFSIDYIKYYSLKTNESIQYIKNSALEYLSAMFPEQCTNKIRLKHYLSKYIHKFIIEKGYCLDKAIAGELCLKLEDKDLNKSINNNKDILESSLKLSPLNSTSIFSGPEVSNNFNETSISAMDSQLNFDIGDSKELNHSISFGDYNFLQSEIANKKIGKKPKTRKSNKTSDSNIIKNSKIENKIELDSEKNKKGVKKAVKKKLNGDCSVNEMEFASEKIKKSKKANKKKYLDNLFAEKINRSPDKSLDNSRIENLDKSDTETNLLSFKASRDSDQVGNIYELKFNKDNNICELKYNQNKLDDNKLDHEISENTASLIKVDPDSNNNNFLNFNSE